MKTARKNKSEFSLLIQNNQGIIHKVTNVYANNSADREDLFQEICLQLWKSYKSFRHESEFSTWMYRVALNTAISTIRKKSKIKIESIDTYSLQIEAEPHEQRENVHLLHSAISKLGYIDRGIILLWLEEKNYDEIASITGITKTNVSVKLVRIKRKLQEMINGK